MTLIALWFAWKSERRWRWLALAAALVVADLIVGPALIAWQLSIMRDLLESR